MKRDLWTRFGFPFRVLRDIWALFRARALLPVQFQLLGSFWHVRIVLKDFYFFSSQLSKVHIREFKKKNFSLMYILCPTLCQQNKTYWFFFSLRVQVRILPSYVLFTFCQWWMSSRISIGEYSLFVSFRKIESRLLVSKLLLGARSSKECMWGWI